MKQNIGSELVDVKIDLAESGPQSFVYNGDGTLNYVEVTVLGVVHRQTFAYSNGKVVSISAWVKQ